MDYFYSKSKCVEFNTFSRLPIGEVCVANGPILTREGELFSLGETSTKQISVSGDDFNLTLLKSGKQPHKTYLIEGILIDIGDNIRVSLKESCLEARVECEIDYEACEVFGGYRLIYFVGQRNLVVIVHNDEIVYISHYDEEKFADQRVFILRLRDMLNHGVVFGVKNGKFETYTIYLDNYELRLKEEFVPFVFLDCVKANNLKYAMQLTSETLRADESVIKDFLPTFDEYISIDNTTHILLKNNTQKGVAKFELNNGLIQNIIL